MRGFLSNLARSSLFGPVPDVIVSICLPVFFGNIVECMGDKLDPIGFQYGDQFAARHPSRIQMNLLLLSTAGENLNHIGQMAYRAPLAFLTTTLSARMNRGDDSEPRQIRDMRCDGLGIDEAS